MRKNVFIILLFSVVTIFCNTTQAAAATSVGGAITSNTTWTFANSPYTVTSTVQIYGTATTPATLTIEPGVVVKFNSGVGIQIGSGTNQGSIVASGTATDRINFTRSATSGTWGNVSFTDGTVDASTIIEYADIQYSSGIIMSSASPTIRNSTITSVPDYGISLTSSNPVIDNVAINNNGSCGISLSSSSPTITGGSLTNLYASGYGIIGSGSPIISSYTVSVFNGVGRYGLYLTTTTSALSISNSTIGNGLYLGTIGIMPTISGNTFTNSDNSPLHVGANTVASILINNTLTGLTSAGRIEVMGEQVNQNATWSKLAAPYWIVSGNVSVYKDATTAATLTVDPGSVVKFASGVGLQVGNGTSKGVLVARGTTTDRITFTRSAVSGTWGGITFNDGTVDATTIIENADIQYSTGLVMSYASPTIKNTTITNVTGYGLNLSISNPVIDTVTITNDGSYGIYLSSSSPIISGGSLTNSNGSGNGIYGSGSPVVSNYSVSIINNAGRYGLYLNNFTSTLSITNSTIVNGLFLGVGGFVPTITGNTFTNSDNSPPHAGANIIAAILASNTFSNLTNAGKIEIVGEQVNRDITWSKLAAPYWVISGIVSVYKDTTTAATLTVDPGTIVKFASGAGLQIGNGTSKGALIARGTTGNRITFTRSAASGNWGNINFNDGTVDTMTIIENADIQYSIGIGMTSASPTIRNSTITNVTGYGLNLTSSNPIIDTVTITNVGTYGIYLSSSSPILSGGSLTNTNATGQGIYGSGSPIINNYSVSIVNGVGRYGLYLSTTTSDFSLINSIIGNGLFIGSKSVIPTITGNTFTNSDNSPPHAGASIIAAILTNNTFTGLTGAGKIEIVGEQVSQNVTWTKLAAPYWVVGYVSVYKDTATATTLTIDPGVVIKFAAGSTIQIGNGTSKGALVARGTTADRITMTRSAVSGYWGGITFNDGTVDATTIIEKADIQYSTGIVMSSASPIIRNSTLTNVTGYGLNLNYSNPIIDAVTITNDGSYGIYLYSSSPTISGGSLTNANANGYGIYGGGSPVISNYTVTIINSVAKYGLYLSPTTSALSLTNTTIANGLFLGSVNITPTITGNTFTNSDNSPLRVGANIVGAILGNNTLTGLTSAGRIEVMGEQVSQDATWSSLAAPYWIVSGNVSVYKDTTTAATLTVNPGTVVKFASGTELQIGYFASKGALVARGTTGNRITFTRSAASGTWAGITFNDGTVDATTFIENADIQYSTGLVMSYASPTLRNSTITNVTGYGLNLSISNPVIDTVTITNDGSYGIYLSSSSPTITSGSLTNSNASGNGIYGSGSPVITNYNVSTGNSAGIYGLYLTSATSALSVTNSTILNGLYLGAGGFIPNITGNTFSNCDNSPPRAGANIIGQVMDSNTFNGLTSSGKIEVVAELVNRDVRWKKFAAPYVVLGSFTVYKDTSSSATLTIDPGVTVKSALYTYITIGSGGSKGVLVANGTAAMPITFTSSQTNPVAGNWSGLNFSGDGASLSVLNYIIVEYAGYGSAYSSANISLSSSSPTIRNATIRNSAGSGIFMTSATNIPKIFDSSITANKWGIYSDNSNPLINNSKVFSNSTAGIWNSSTTAEIDARGNWWGVASGPAHASNPAGTGNAVSNKVLFNPWLGQPPSLLNIANVSVNPAAFNPVGDSVTISAIISASANWKITITDSAITEVKTFTGIGTTISLIWSGENSSNVKVADGTYNVTIEATDTNFNIATPVIGTIKVSRLMPIAIINSPADNLMYQGGTSIDIYATANDTTDFKNYMLEYGAGEDPVSWIYFVGQTTTQVNNAKIYSWNTAGYPGGIYTLRLTATDNAGNTQTKTARVRLLWISSNVQSESYISPNNDGIKDSTIISATSTHPADWNIAISNSGSTVVRTLTTAFTSTLNQAWDGKDDAGTVVPDGTYTFKIIATDPVSGVQSAPKTGTIISDITAPTVTISSPAPGGLLRNSVIVTGTASDANFAGYSLDYGPSDGNGPWTAINSGTSSVSSATLGTWITNDQGGTVPLANGSYLLRLVASDKAGNSAGFMIPVIADNLILSSIAVNSHTINTFAAETSTISFNINAPATVTLKIVPEKLGSNGTPVFQTSQTITSAGSYSFTWNGKDLTSKDVPDEAYLYILEASDGTKTDSYNPPAPTGTGSVTCTQSTGFDPSKNLPMTVTYSLAQPARVNIFIGWYKVLDSFPSIPGSHTFDWDGRNPSNELLNTFVNSSCSIASLLRENYIVTYGDKITVSGLKTDPYSQHLAFGQFTRIEYTLPRDAYVTLKLTSPTGTALTLINNQLQTAGPYQFEWDGMDDADTTGKKTLLSLKGNYMVSVQTVNPATGTSSTARANLKIGY